MDAVIERLDLSDEGLRRHDARSDVRILAQAVRCMWQRLGAEVDSCPVPLGIGHLPK